MPDVTVGANEVSSGLITLVADAVSTVTFARNIGAVTIIHADLASNATVWYTTDGSTPSVGGKNSRPLPAGWADEGRATTNSAGGDVVKLISSGAPIVTVVAAD